MNKTIFVLAFVLLLVFQAFYFRANEKYNDSKAEREAREAPQAPMTPHNDAQMLQEQRVSNFNLIDAKKQTKEFELWSKVAHKAMGTAEWTLDQVKAQFYSEDVTYTVTGDRGSVDELKKVMTIVGNVKLVSSNGHLFYTDQLNYDPETKKIISDKKVSLEGPPEKEGRLYLEGVGLDVNMNTNIMTMQSQVKGFKPMSDKRVMHISSQSADFSARQKSVAFKNNVLIKVDQMRVNGNLAQFQYKDGKLDTLHMDGGIHFRDPDKTGSAGEAIVYFNEDKYIFRKKPFITQSENELIGDEITVYNGGKRVQVKKAKVEYYQTEEKK